ncbi:MAG: hypothetical protein LBN25_00115 [Christensenellaceae bacterium]|jgi:hypothetical protein|nr:hypothetical protein [Christensenellaceae bacterium]
MTNLEIGLIVSVAVLAVAVAVLCVLFVKAQKKSKGQTSLKADTVYVKKGERYSVNDKIFDENGEANATHREGDFVLSVNTEYTVGDKGGILPGHYSILTSG